MCFWKPPSLNELTTYYIWSELTHLDSNPPHNKAYKLYLSTSLIQVISLYIAKTKLLLL